MEGTVVPEGGQIELQALGLDQPVGRRIVDDDVGEVRLARHRAQAGELGGREPGKVQGPGVGIGHPLQLGRLGAGGLDGVLAELAQA